MTQFTLTTFGRNSPITYLGAGITERGDAVEEYSVQNIPTRPKRPLRVAETTERRCEVKLLHTIQYLLTNIKKYSPPKLGQLDF